MGSDLLDRLLFPISFKYPLKISRSSVPLRLRITSMKNMQTKYIGPPLWLFARSCLITLFCFSLCPPLVRRQQLNNNSFLFVKKVIQNVGLCIGFYDLLDSSDGLIGHGTGLVNVNGSGNSKPRRGMGLHRCDRVLANVCD